MHEIEREGFLAHAMMPAFRRKVESATAILTEAIAIAPAYVAISWGKDSIVTLHLAQSVDPNIEAIHLCLESRPFLDNYDEVIATYRDRFGLPNYRDITLNEDNFIPNAGLTRLFNALTPNNPIMGVRAEESKHRRISIHTYGPIHRYASTGRIRTFPIHNWTATDVWAYAIAHNLPMLNAYDRLEETGIAHRRSPQSRTSPILATDHDTSLQAYIRAQLRIISSTFHQWEPIGRTHTRILSLLQTLRQDPPTFTSWDAFIGYIESHLSESGAIAADIDAAIALLNNPTQTISPAIARLHTLGQTLCQQP